MSFEKNIKKVLNRKINSIKKINFNKKKINFVN